MQTKAALLHEPGQDWAIDEIDVGDPVAGEVPVSYTHLTLPTNREV